MTIEIDLSRASGRNYAGKPNGRAFRKLENLDERDADGKETLILIFPENAYGITSSYFVGLLGNSMLKSGAEDKFKKRIELKGANSSQKHCIENAIHHVFLANSTESVF